MSLRFLKKQKNPFAISIIICILQAFVTPSGYSMPLNKNILTKPILYKYKALCSLYSDYQDCDVKVYSDKISGNFSSEYLIFDTNNIKFVKLYDSRRQQVNVALGIASTIILGPIGLIGFLFKHNVGDVDYGFGYADGIRTKTAFIRFKNNRVSADFAEKIKPFLQSLKAEESDINNK